MTQTVALISGIFELAISFLLGLGVSYASFRLLSYLTSNLRELRDLRQDQTAVGILSASMLVSTALVTKQALSPIVSTLQTKLFEGITLGAALTVIAVSLGCAAFAMVVSVLAIAFGAKMFLRLTRGIDATGPTDKIGQNNLAVALTLGAVMVVMGLFLATGTQSLLAAAVPEPAATNIRVMGDVP